MKIVIMEMVTAMLVSANAPLILSMPKIVQFLDVSLHSQSHRSTMVSLVEQYKIDCAYLAYFVPFFFFFEIKKQF